MSKRLHLRLHPKAAPRLRQAYFCRRLAPWPNARKAYLEVVVSVLCSSCGGPGFQQGLGGIEPAPLHEPPHRSAAAILEHDIAEDLSGLVALAAMHQILGVVIARALAL